MTSRSFVLGDDLLRTALTQTPPAGLADQLFGELSLALEHTPQRRRQLISWPWTPVLPGLPAQAAQRRLRTIGLLVAAALLIALAFAAIGLVGHRLPPPYGLAKPGLIAFATNGNIAVANPDGSGVRVLTSGAGEGSFPTWSPDGTKIAFWSKSSNLAPLSLVMLDPRTGSRTVVSGSLNIQSDPAPISWSTDSRRLAFPAIIGSGDPEVYVVGADGSDLRSVAPRLHASEPAWSPDGSEIAFRGQDPADPASVRLYMARADGTGLRALATAQYTAHYADTTSLPWADIELTWSPDGRQIAYASIGSTQAGGYVIAVTDVATGHTQELTVGDFDGRPVWSPDGRWIAFARGPVGGPNKVAVVRPDGSDLRFLAGVQTADSPLSWSPDGTSILAYTPDRAQVEVIPIDGSTPSTFPAPGANTAPSWQRLP